jgi:FkbM family methyltransferase
VEPSQPLGHHSLGPAWQKAPAPNPHVVWGDDGLDRQFSDALKQSTGLGGGVPFRARALHVMRKDIGERPQRPPAKRSVEEPRLSGDDGVAIVDHDAKATSRPQDPQNFARGAGGIGRVVDDSPGVGTVERIVGEGEILDVRDAQVRGKALGKKAPTRGLETYLAQVDARARGTRPGEPQVIRPSADAHLEQTLTTRLLEASEPRDERLALVTNALELTELARLLRVRHVGRSARRRVPVQANSFFLDELHRALGSVVGCGEDFYHSTSSLDTSLGASPFGGVNATGCGSCGCRVPGPLAMCVVIVARHGTTSPMYTLSKPLKATRRLASELSAISATASMECSARYLASIVATLPAIVRTRTLVPADAMMANRLCHFRPFGTRVALPGSLFAGAREIYARQVYFALPQFRLRSGDTVVDLGANHGVFTTLAACIAKKVIAIEAQSGFFDGIRQNIALNHCAADVSLEFGLVGARSGMFADETVLATASHYGGQPPTLAMADVFRTHGVERVDFLKMDIEGSEFALLREHSEWLAKVSKIVMEVHPEFGAATELVESLTRAGFRTDLRDDELRPTSRLTDVRGGFLYGWRDSAA